MWKWVEPNWAADKPPWCCFVSGRLCCCCTSPSRFKHCFAEGEDGVLLNEGQRSSDIAKVHLRAHCSNMHCKLQHWVRKYNFFLIFLTNVNITSYASKRRQLQAEKIRAINLHGISSGLDRVGSGNQWSIECTQGLRRQLSECTVRTILPTGCSVVFTSSYMLIFNPAISVL